MCGSVGFTIAGGVTPIQLCHAERCRKATGSAFAPEMLCAADAITWVRGQALVSEYEAPLLREPPAYKRAFCSRCGSPLPIAIPGTPFVVLNPGVLDDDPETRPFRHAFTAQRACWHDIADDLPQFEHQPPRP